MKEKNHSMEKNDYIEEERQKEKKRSIGKFEKIFWVTILIFAVIFIILKIMGYVNHSKFDNEYYI